MRKFYDTEYRVIITEDVLRKEFEALKSNDPETYNYSFSSYIRNCCEATLVEVI